MPTYLWRNKKTGERVEIHRPMSDATLPPESGEKCDWERLYSFGLGRIEGAGGSPPRVAKVKNDPST